MIKFDHVLHIRHHDMWKGRNPLAKKDWTACSGQIEQVLVPSPVQLDVVHLPLQGDQSEDALAPVVDGLASVVERGAEDFVSALVARAQGLSVAEDDDLVSYVSVEAVGQVEETRAEVGRLVVIGVVEAQWDHLQLEGGQEVGQTHSGREKFNYEEPKGDFICDKVFVPSHEHVLQVWLNVSLDKLVQVQEEVLPHVGDVLQGSVFTLEKLVEDGEPEDAQGLKGGGMFCFHFEVCQGILGTKYYSIIQNTIKICIAHPDTGID